MLSLSSTELNYLVFRYLHESGFTHSAYAFGFEAGIDKSSIDGNVVPPGALVTFLQKGLQFLELEADLSSNSDAEMEEDLSFLQPLDLITKDAYQLQKMVREKKDRMNAAAIERNVSKEEGGRENGREVEEERRDKEKEEGEDGDDKLEKDREQEIGKVEEKTHEEDCNLMEK